MGRKGSPRQGWAARTSSAKLGKHPSRRPSALAWKLPSAAGARNGASLSRDPPGAGLIRTLSRRWRKARPRSDAAGPMVTGATGDCGNSLDQEGATNLPGWRGYPQRCQPRAAALGGLQAFGPLACAESTGHKTGKVPLERAGPFLAALRTPGPASIASRCTGYT